MHLLDNNDFVTSTSSESSERILLAVIWLHFFISSVIFTCACYNCYFIVISLFLYTHIVSGNKLACQMFRLCKHVKYLPVFLSPSFSPHHLSSHLSFIHNVWEVAMWGVSKRSRSELNSLYSKQCLCKQWVHRRCSGLTGSYMLLLVSSAADVFRAQGGKKQ